LYRENIRRGLGGSKPVGGGRHKKKRKEKCENPLNDTKANFNYVT